MSHRTGQFWTYQEEGLILLRLAEGKTLKDVSKELLRSERAVEWRRNALIVNLFRQGRSCAYLANMFMVTTEVVENAIRPNLTPSLQTACSMLRNS